MVMLTVPTVMTILTFKTYKPCKNIDSIYRNMPLANIPSNNAPNAASIGALSNTLTKKIRLYSQTMWGDVTTKTHAVTTIHPRISSRTIPTRIPAILMMLSGTM